MHFYTPKIQFNTHSNTKAHKSWYKNLFFKRLVSKPCYLKLNDISKYL
ncbi:50S ribosomal protein L28 domain protein [Helicobacter pylori HP260BFii]|nr:50S ribosomal protein L28 domain protein [Helicobacter pylori HP260BFii]